MSRCSCRFWVSSTARIFKPRSFRHYFGQRRLGMEIARCLWSPESSDERRDGSGPFRWRRSSQMRLQSPPPTEDLAGLFSAAPSPSAGGGGGGGGGGGRGGGGNGAARINLICQASTDSALDGGGMVPRAVRSGRGQDVLVRDPVLSTRPACRAFWPPTLASRLLLEVNPCSKALLAEWVWTITAEGITLEGAGAVCVTLGEGESKPSWCAAACE